ncbi:unnamed protein product [Trichobilharzia regenti]|nr:unnamed protein product [Trichobilharzia regenti]
MFQSEFGQKDLIFSDDTESLSLIPWENQTYEAWLGERFIQMVENLEVISNRHENGLYNSVNRLQLMTVYSYVAVILFILSIINYHFFKNIFE